MDKKKYEQKKIMLQNMALRSPGREAEGDFWRQVYAQTVAAPILERVQQQSSVLSIMNVVEIAPDAQAEFQVFPSVLASTNKFTGAPVDPLLVYNHPGEGPTHGQILRSKTIIVPTDEFQHESGFAVRAAERAMFSYEEAHREDMKDAVLTNIEDNGWDLFQAVVGDVAFPAAQSVEIAASDPGAGTFSRQLFSKMLKLAHDIGLITQGRYTPTIWCSNDSYEEFTNWDIATQFDVSTPGQISEDLKTRLNNIAGVSNVGSYRGVPIVALRRLGTGDVFANKDLVYLILRSNIPDSLVLPVRLSRTTSRVSGMEEFFPMEMLNDPTSVYQFNEIRTKLRWQAGYACLDARTFYTGVIDRS